MKLQINHETLRQWVRRAETDAGTRPGLTTDERARIRELEREVMELRRANEILNVWWARQEGPIIGWPAVRTGAARVTRAQLGQDVASDRLGAPPLSELTRTHATHHGDGNMLLKPKPPRPDG